MENVTRSGFNRTGAQTSLHTVQNMQTFADEQSPSGPAHIDGVLEGRSIASVRAEFVHEAERIGSVPIPTTLTGVLATGLSKLTGRRPEVLVDKLGERLAFERTGVRLYQALIDKAEAVQADVALPFAIGDLKHIRDEELEHMHIVTSALEGLGAAPTAQTPCADVAGVASSGAMQVLSDPRTTIAQCLETILSVELTDGAGWDLLIRLSGSAGQDELIKPFREALAREQEHAQQVKGWLERAVVDDLD